MEIGSMSENKQKEEHKKESKAGLEDFKKKYSVIKGKYSFPDYVFMNENFEIEILADVETELLVRRIRKVIVDKISSNLRAMEMFLNPQNVSLFIYGVVKFLDNNDKEIMTNLYKKFAEFEIESFSLENDYSEAREAEFIKKVCSEWGLIIKDLEKISQIIKINLKKNSKSNEKSYFG